MKYLNLFLILIILVSGCSSQDIVGSDMQSDLPGPKSYGECESDSDCVLILCNGNYAVHKNVLSQLDEFAEKWCANAKPVLKPDGVLCSSYKQCILKKEPYIQRNRTVNDNLSKPGLPPDARQPFSDD